MIFVLSPENKTYINNILAKHRCICLYHWYNCAYCQMMMPTWNKLCKQYTKNKDIIIINIERSVMELLEEQYYNNINGFPTIIRYDKGKRKQEYANRREYKLLNDFIKS